MHRSHPAHRRDGDASESPEPEPATARDVPPPWLRDVVEHRIVPSLLDAGSAARRRPARPEPTAAELDALVGRLLADDAPGCLELVEGLRAAGVPDDAIRDALIAPAARRLGALWDADRCDFGQVTIGLGRLQSLVHDLGAEACCVPAGAAGRVLLGLPDGAQHLLGVVLVADAFRRAGWHVCFDPCADEAALRARIREERFDLVAVSAGLDRDYPAVRALLGALRADSLNPAVVTMAGGPALSRWPALDADLGADLVAADAGQAVALAAAVLRAGGVPKAAVAAARRPSDAVAWTNGASTNGRATNGTATTGTATPGGSATPPSPGVLAAPLTCPATPPAAPEQTTRRARFRRAVAVRLADTLARFTARAA